MVVFGLTECYIDCSSGQERELLEQLASLNNNPRSRSKPQQPAKIKETQVDPVAEDSEDSEDQDEDPLKKLAEFAGYSSFNLFDRSGLVRSRFNVRSGYRPLDAPR